MSLEVLSSVKFLMNALESEFLVLMASTTTCPPCKMFTPIVEEVSMISKYSKIVFAKINMDEHPSSNDIIGITSVPTILFFKNSNEVHREVGAITKEKLISLVESYLF